MITHSRLFCLFLLVSVSGILSAQDKYIASIDLVNIENDKVTVTITAPAIDRDTIEFHIPRIVPGTYSISDFGRFVSDFAALTEDGDTLFSQKAGTNRWRIANANDLRTITYKIDDSFDRSSNYRSNFIFEPGGTSIDKDRDVHVINTFGFVGYLEDMSMLPFELIIRKKPTIYGSTALNAVERTDTLDRFSAINYNFLADSPLLYCKPDTITKEIAGADILVSVHSPNDRLNAKSVMNNIYDLMLAQTDYLGGKLPVDRYAYLIYLTDSSPLSGSMGALEHSYSSLYFLPEFYPERLFQTIRDVAAHEFLHIVTPLNIHSKEIHYFDYINPDMSQHLWLYEGVTEYSSMHVQVRNNLYSFDTFLGEIRQKIRNAEKYPQVSFTKMSENILEDEYEQMYGNVYEKGALIAMCLDLYLIKYSEGSIDLPTLMRELSKKYGPNAPFEDENLFQEIVALTYPEVGQFLQQHVAGLEPLPLSEVLKWAGVEYARKKETESFTLGNIGIGYDNERDMLVISDISDLNEFGKDMGYQEGDYLVTLNEKEISLRNAENVLADFDRNTKDGDKVRIEVLRTVDGQEQTVKLEAKATKIKKRENYVLRTMEETTEAQKKVRKVWIEGIKD